MNDRTKSIGASEVAALFGCSPWQALLDADDQHLVAGKRLRLNPDGYVRFASNGRWHYLHRVISGAKKDQHVDHINGDRRDNRKDNLRLCSRSQNMANRGKQNNNTSGYKGVFKASASTWMARVRKDGVVFHIGTFNNKIDAARAYDSAALVLFGNFANINFR